MGINLHLTWLQTHFTSVLMTQIMYAPWFPYTPHGFKSVYIAFSFQWYYKNEWFHNASVLTILSSFPVWIARQESWVNFCCPLVSETSNDILRGDRYLGFGLHFPFICPGNPCHSDRRSPNSKIRSVPENILAHLKLSGKEKRMCLFPENQ